MNDTLLWLAYIASAVAAYWVVRHRGWRVVPAMLAGMLITLIAWAALLLLTRPDERPDFLGVDIALNGSFGLIFAAAGAAIGSFVLLNNGTQLPQNQSTPDDSPSE